MSAQRLLCSLPILNLILMLEIKLLQAIFLCYKRQIMGIHKNCLDIQKPQSCNILQYPTEEKQLRWKLQKPLLIKSFQCYYRFSQRLTKVSIFCDTLTVPLFCRSTSRGVADSSPGNHCQGNLTYLSMPASNRLTAGLSIS